MILGLIKMDIQFEFKPKYVAFGSTLCTFGLGINTYIKGTFPTLEWISWVAIILFLFGSIILLSGFFQISFTACKVISEWNWEFVHKLMISIKSHDEIRIINTYIPNMDKLISLLRDIYIRDKKIISIKILLLDFENAKYLVEARFKYRPESTEMAIYSIKENIRQFNELKKQIERNWVESNFSGKVDIQIRLYDHIPIGAYYQIGQNSMELAFLYTKKSGTSGPALYCKNVRTKHWRSFAENFEDSWNSARPFSVD